MWDENFTVDFLVYLSTGKPGSALYPRNSRRPYHVIFVLAMSLSGPVGHRDVQCDPQFLN